MTHHANLIIGNPAWGLLRIDASVRDGGADTIHHEYDRMGIDDVRALIQDTLRKPIEKSQRTFIISARSILHDAQNALLKIFEEPNEYTVLYLIVPSEDMLLPTLRSRLHLIASETYHVDTNVFTAFHAMSYAERLTCVAEKLKAEESAWIGELLRGAEIYAEKTRNTKIMKMVLEMEANMRMAGCSKKILLEHFALSL